MLTASSTLPGLTSSVPAARRFAEQVLTGWGHPDAGWTAAQVVSELASNCALHARTAFTVVVDARADVVRLEVSDESPGAVQPRSYSETATTGRGLRMVSALCLEWGVELHDGGKTVWVLLPRDDAPPKEPDLESLLGSFDDQGGAVVPLQPRAGGGPAVHLANAA